MTETVRKRLRWPWMALAVVLLLVGGPIAWRFRPLNKSERRLLGTFEVSFRDGVLGLQTPGFVLEEVTFYSNRQYVRRILDVGHPVVQRGSWEAGQDTITLKPISPTGIGVPWHARLRAYVSELLQPRREAMGWDGPDCFWMTYHDLRYRRAPDPAR